MDKKPSISAVLKEAWSLIPGLKWPVFKRFLFVMLIVIVLMAIIIYMLSSYKLISNSSPPLSFHLIMFVLGFMIIYFATRIFIPAIMMGVRRAIGMPIDIKIIKSECAKVKDKLSSLILFYAVLVNVVAFFSRLIIVPDFMGIIFCIIITVACFFLFVPINVFAFPLIITRKMNPTAALDSAYKMMWLYWKEIIGAYLIVDIIPVILQFSTIFLAKLGPAFVAVFCFIQLLMWVWLLPMIFIMGGIFFRDAYGLKKITQTA